MRGPLNPDEDVPGVEMGILQNRGDIVVLKVTPEGAGSTDDECKQMCRFHFVQAPHS